MLNTDTTYRYCCITKGDVSRLRDEDGNYFRVGMHTIKDVWKSPTLEDARKKMLNGEKVAACEHCYIQEEVGKESYRIKKNKEWVDKLGDEIDKRIENVHDFLPADLDLRLGNLCNLKCRMCNPLNSSQIAKEHYDIKKDSQFYEVYKQEFGESKNKEKLLNLPKMFEGNYMWNDIISMIPHLKKVYMTGGEPTLIQNNYRFMEEVIATGKNNDIHLFFNINCTNVTDRFLNLITKFKRLSINPSIDGYGSVNEYIRSPSKWEKIEDNFKKLLKTQAQITITPVFQIYNVYSIGKLFNYMDHMMNKYNRPIEIDVLFNTHPYSLSVTNLPQSIKKKATKKLQDCNVYNQSVQDCINYLNSNPMENSKQHLSNFLNYTASLDKHRNESFEKTFPELYGDLCGQSS
jgi:organic radical activating enzyme